MRPIMLKNLNEKACHMQTILYHSLSSLAHTVHPSYMVLSCSFQGFGLLCCLRCLVGVHEYSSRRESDMVSRKREQNPKRPEQIVGEQPGTLSSSAWTQTWTVRFMTCSGKSSIVVSLRLLEQLTQFSSTCTAMTASQSSVGGWPWWALSLSLVLAKWDSRASEQLSCISLSLQQRSQFHLFTTRVSVKNSAEQPMAEQTGFFLFQKMTNIFRQCLQGDSFPAGAKMLCSPTNQIAAFTCGICHVTAPMLNYAPKFELRPQQGGAQYQMSSRP